ncbi:MAG: methionine adenosyltransferase [Alphaproteobacteria bacterium]|nr:methionine adenosyltransferase [Alphaproteobacteria bacterium]
MRRTDDASPLVLEAMADPATRGAEFVECKGPGHPDTLCDAVAEAASRALSRAYLDRFDRVLHHNVDKVLLVGGESQPRFGGGRVLAPIRIVVAGRATSLVGTERIDVEDIVRRAADAVLRGTLARLDPVRDVVIESRIRPGSVDLAALFARGAGNVPRANDSSAGAGYAPLSPLEQVVREATARLADPATRPSPACGEDVKIAGIRRGARCDLTIACAGVAPALPDLAAYRRFRTDTTAAVVALARARLGAALGEVAINAADDLEAGSCYLTVTGTSAESGDDGETGRGNRVNGLIAVGRPMTMEATAGKNAISHVGKLYNIVAQELADSIVAAVDGVVACECVVASRIGAPITTPSLAHLRVALAAGATTADVEPSVRAQVDAALAGVVSLWPRVVAGEVRLF